VTYLTAAQVLFIHARLLAETGGAPGVRDLGLLEAAIARPRATFDGVDLYPDLFSKAAALIASLIGNHPFVDGNKRVGVTAAAIFLQRNGARLTASNHEVEVFALSIAQAHLTAGEIAAWFAHHTTPAIP
jgi:death-on-curing protein